MWCVICVIDVWYGMSVKIKCLFFVFNLINNKHQVLYNQLQLKKFIDSFIRKIRNV